MTTAARRSKPGTTSGRAWSTGVAKAALVSGPSRGRLVANVTVCRPAVRSADRGTAPHLDCVPCHVCRAVAIDDPRGIRRDRRQSSGIPMLSAPNAPPGAAGFERALRQGHAGVAHRTGRRPDDVRLRRRSALLWQAVGKDGEPLGVTTSRIGNRGLERAATVPICSRTKCGLVGDACLVASGAGVARLLLALFRFAAWCFDRIQPDGLPDRAPGARAQRFRHQDQLKFRRVRPTDRASATTRRSPTGRARCYRGMPPRGGLVRVLADASVGTP